MPCCFTTLVCSLGLGETMVQALLLQYPTWHDLTAAFTREKLRAQAQGGDPVRAAQRMLAGVQLGVGSAASGRTVGESIAKKIYTCLFSKGVVV